MADRTNHKRRRRPASRQREPLTLYRRGRIRQPGLSALLTEACGFAVTVASKPAGHQAMPLQRAILDDENVAAFWNHDLCYRRQFYPSPAAAAIAFLRRWRACASLRDGRQPELTR